MPATSIGANSRQELVRSGLVTLFVALFGLFAAVAAAKRLSAPLRSLTSTARALAAGEPNVRADETLPGEFAQVAIEINKAIEARDAFDEMRIARGQAQAASEAKSQFLAHMSHEIRTPMNAIQGLVQLVLRTNLDAKQRDYLNKTKLSADALLDLLNQILDLSKIEAGKVELELRPFVLDDVLKRVTSIVGHRADTSGITFSVSTDDGVPRYLVGDDQRLCQVLVNLAGNAVKFTKLGGVSLHVSASEVRPERLRLCVSVRDTGIGMKPEQIQRLFQPFSQADSGTTREFGGTGLGLSISKQLVELMGGSMEVQSTAGVGSQFSFTAVLERGFPEESSVPANPPNFDAMRPVAEDSSLRGCRVLLVEDNELNQLVARELLTSVAKAEVRVCSSGFEALHAIETASFDVVLMDIQMPGMDGYETTRRIRALRNAPQVPIIAMTANATSRDRDRCIEAGMNDFVTKPFEPYALFASIGQWVNKTEQAPSQEQETVRPAPPGLSLETGLARCLGKPELYHRVLSRFLQSGKVLPERVAQAVAAKDVGRAAALLHSLVSTASTIGAARMAGLAAEFDASLQAGDEARWPSFSTELVHEYDLVHAEASNYLAAMAARA